MDPYLLDCCRCRDYRRHVSLNTETVSRFILVPVSRFESYTASVCSFLGVSAARALVGVVYVCKFIHACVGGLCDVTGYSWREPGGEASAVEEREKGQEEDSRGRSGCECRTAAVVLYHVVVCISGIACVVVVVLLCVERIRPTHE